MRISYIDVPHGIRIDAKKKLVKEVYAALDEAYRIPDTRIFLREWPLESVILENAAGPICVRRSTHMSRIT